MSVEIAYPQADINDEELGQGTDIGLGIYPSHDNPKISMLTDEGQVSYYGTPMTSHQFRRSRLNDPTYKEYVDGYVAVVRPSDTMNRIQHLPAYTIQSILQSRKQASAENPPLGIQDNYTGRIADFEQLVAGSTDMMGIDDPNGTHAVVHSAHDSLYTKGHIWMEYDAKLSKLPSRRHVANGGRSKGNNEERPTEGAEEYNPLSGRNGEGLAHMTAIFLRDARTRYPLPIPEFRNHSDFTLISVISSADVNPVDGFVNTLVRTEDGTRQPRVGMLSFMLKDQIAEFRQRIGGEPEHFTNVIRATIGGFGKVYNRMLYLHHQHIEGKRGPVDFEREVWDPVVHQTGKSSFPAAADEMKRFYRCVDGDVYKLRLPARAHFELLSLHNFLKNNPNTSDASRERIRNRSGHITKEFIETITMMTEVDALEAVMDHDNSPNPIRMKFHGLDDIDFAWARAISSIGEGDEATIMAAQAAAQRFGSDQVRSVNFLMTGTRGNRLYFNQEHLHSRHRSQFKEGGFFYAPNMAMQYDSPDGLFPGEMVRSFYDPRRPLSMPGLIAHFMIDGDRMATKPIEGFALDVKEAPAAVAQRIIKQMGLLESRQHAIPNPPTFSKIFHDIEQLPPARPIIITRNEAGDGKTRGAHLKVVAGVRDGDVLQFVRTPDKSAIELHTAKDGLWLNERSQDYAKEHAAVLARKGILRRKNKGADGGPSPEAVKVEIRRLKGTYEVMREHPLPKNAQTVGGIVMANHVPHIFVTGKMRDAVTRLMPSENRQHALRAQRAAQKTQEADESSAE